MVRPGELNLMTAGAGICHSEVSTVTTTVLHGVQLWVALPDAARDAERGFAHYAPEPVAVPGAMLRVFLGELAGSRSPVHTFTPLLGAQIDLDVGAHVDLDIDPSFEHGVLLDQGGVEAAGTALDVADLAYRPTGRENLTLHNTGAGPARAIVLGGPPFGEELVMWWNFVGRSHDDIAAYRRQWENRDERFGDVEGYRGAVERLPSPPLPNATLRPRPIPKGNP
jgi:redox-sensitive bicupin YhaK (pirin superfamily)